MSTYLSLCAEGGPPRLSAPLSSWHSRATMSTGAEERPSGPAPALTLEVEGFAKIRKARVTLAPLMLFVGPNNTGKSFLSMLLWGLHRSPPIIEKSHEETLVLSLLSEWPTKARPISSFPSASLSRRI